MDTNTGRTLQYSLEAEQSVLGSMLMDRDCIADVAEIVKESLDKSITFTEALMSRKLISENDLKEILSSKEIHEPRTSV